MLINMSLVVHPFFEPSSCSYSYIVACPDSRSCVVIDAALGVSAEGGHARPQMNTHTADLMLDLVEAHRYRLRYILETHVHADRPSAAAYLKSRALCAQTVIGRDTPHVTGYERYVGEGDKLCLDGSCARVLATPGHTPGCVSYQFDDFVFVGDTLFMPDTGTARCDFPGGCAGVLYRSINRILSLPPETRLFMCHDYGGDGRRHRFVTTVAEERSSNIHVATGCCEQKFVAMRRARDATLAAPKWAEFSIPFNLHCQVPDSARASASR